MSRSLFLLGAPDAEMSLIETLLRDAGQAFFYSFPDRGIWGGALRLACDPPAR